ncbi:hypothetical protein B0J17DRAFT_703919 [Rhizoctonia solani]|nr:hypothetical protein B0J17DRAFT_703919 [Rhizoctonia solani]
MYAKRVSGPYSLSCVTCRERRKKCDRAHPTCTRCEGGFTCLGYASRKTGPADSPPEPAPQAQTVPPFELNAVSRRGRSDFPEATALPTNGILSDVYNIHNALALMQATLVLPRQPPASPFMNPSLAGNANGERSIQLNLGVYLTPNTSVVTTEYIISQYERAYGLVALELTNIQGSSVKTCVIGRIIVSKGACLSLFIGAKAFEAAISEYRTQFTKQYVKTLDTFEKHISTINYNGLDRFTIADVTISFLTGLPQLVSWDPTFLPGLVHFGWEEWLPACPVMFVLVLCRINMWRQRDQVTRDPNEWRRCEKDIKEWRPDCHCARDPSQSWRTIGRLSVQEALRHMVLIYLYMGMRGSKSDDHEVQVSCQQIVKLCKLVDANPNMAVHLHFPAIIESPPLFNLL